MSMTCAVRVERFGPGESMPAPRPGDFILVRGDFWISRFVWLVQWLKLRGRDDPRALHWSHAALVAGRGGRIVEVVYAGIRASHLERYRDTDYFYVRVDAPLRQRIAAVAFAESRLGRPYGRLGFPALAVALLTRGRWCRRVWPLHNCAALVALALARTGANFPRPAHDMLPADLARYYNVTT